jgi:hypothetical protein
MSNNQKIDNSPEIMRSTCDLLACMLQVKKVALLLVFEKSTILQFESFCPNYPSFDMSVVHNIWCANSDDATRSFGLNPSTCPTHNESIEIFYRLAPWVKCLRVISFQSELARGPTLPQVFICLLDNKASSLNKKFSEELVIIEKFMSEIVSGAINGVGDDGNPNNFEKPLKHFESI